ncbi:unnamed protein product [Ectocarpus sp. CCAP 1310/34]|nr:unnamed protein product [Ectocarpus sp. CCAP 1310/34]
MDSQFIPKAIDMVKDAIAADNNQDYETALGLYKKSLEYFMTGLKYEPNPMAKATIMKRVEGYMKRAETLKEIVEEQAAAKNGMGKGGGGGGGVTIFYLPCASDCNECETFLA